MTAILQAAGIVPNIVDEVHVHEEGTLHVAYKDKDVAQGVLLTPQETQEPPRVDIFGRGLFHLLMIDPDAPSPDNPIYAEFLHWMVLNIPDGDMSKGREAVKYMGPAPLKGIHRYVFFLFKHPSEAAAPLEVPSELLKERKHFSTRGFMAKCGQDAPVSATWFTSQPTSA